MLSFVFSLQDFYVEEPEGYSEKELMRVAQAAESAYQAPEGIEAQKPNIIMIMNEAWSSPENAKKQTERQRYRRYCQMIFFSLKRYFAPESKRNEKGS